MEKKESSRKLFDDFSKKTGIVEWPEFQKLKVNPFIYKGKVIGLRAHFKEMLSEKDGLFFRGEPFIVSDLPIERFTGEKEVFLAGKVMGKKMVKMPMMGEINLLYLIYVDAFICKDQNCSEITSWAK
jgi:hypothetical protein